jgi:hypothetical protein
MRPEKTGYTVLPSCVLHNILRQRAKSPYNPTSSANTEGLDTGKIIAGDKRQLKTSDGPQTQGARNACQEAKQCSLQYKNYFTNEGQVTWRHKFLLLAISSLQKSAINYSITICIQQIYQ